MQEVTGSNPVAPTTKIEYGALKNHQDNAYYCEEHIKPTQPGVTNFRSNKPEDILSRNQKDVHPCPEWLSAGKPRLKEKITSKKKIEIVISKNLEEKMIRSMKEEMPSFPKIENHEIKKGVFRRIKDWFRL